MFLRLLHVSINIDRQPEFHKLYEHEIIPVLKNMPGCLYAGLVQDVQHREEGMSLTLWDTREHAETYERSGVFENLLARSRPFFSDSPNWTMRLSENLELEYGPVPQEPVVHSYSDAGQNDSANLHAEVASSMYLRIVSMVLQPDKIREFLSLYDDHILPSLRNTRGCRYVHLAENAANRSEMLSITLWNSRQDAESYESSGLFERLKEKIRPTLSALYQWKMGLEKEMGKEAVTSEDLSVRSYTVVMGQAFR
jgi:heme-degrading monooxygenase HmoA